MIQTDPPWFQNPRITAPLRLGIAAAALVSCQVHPGLAGQELLSAVLLANALICVLRMRFGGSLAGDALEVLAYAAASALSGGLESVFAPFLAVAILFSSARIAPAQEKMAVSVPAPSEPEHLPEISDPERTLATLARRLAETLCAFERADACHVVVRDVEGSLMIAEAKRGGISGLRTAGSGEEHAYAALLALRPDLSFTYCHGGEGPAAVRAINRASAEAATEAARLAPGIAKLFGAGSFICLPLEAGPEGDARVLIASRRVPHGTAGVPLLAALVGQTGAAMKQVRRAGMLAQRVAREERNRICNDLRDGTVQPYVGLKLALEALRRRLSRNDPLAAELDQLATLASEGILELREYIERLKNAGEPAARAARSVSLVASIQREAERFSRCYGIDVRLTGNDDLALQEPLGDAVRHLVREALFNVHRHTTAEHASIDWRTEGSKLEMRFCNDEPAAQTAPQFRPRSLNDRAGRLGGRVAVAQRSAGQTAVSVEIPLRPGREIARETADA